MFSNNSLIFISILSLIPKTLLNGIDCGLSKTIGVQTHECRTHNRTVGGSDATIDAFPWMASVVALGYCGSVIIGNRWVLTAAHCLYDQNHR